ncbi:tungsten ABC transporter substrate-binding protein [Candidatus Atribacteria bacterium RBG_19FT_COMBO_35_14]|uniref:Tungsten ABC transporter substrate-binding protein n=1 Tax=Candidatus Sediminicultor quintus TaxID=1797291 RepID=A0A1F5A5K5_9BACT|nr:MAG: tungsten ABC transporter substrate-binding protein [Candidatus Atribacteria bacterium RBG_19FT_COMBO_35_14]
MKKNIIFRAILILSISLLLIGMVYAEPIHLKLATTTSTENSGLLNILLPPFEDLFNIKVDVIAVGTGAAIKLGENGDVDIILTHDPDAEDKFVQNGKGVNRRDVMYNDFIVLGPSNDPAKIKGMKNVVSAFTNITNQQAFFVSRGDASGTDQKEKSLWQMANIKPGKEFYLEIGQGMGVALQTASEKQAYVLCDRGTFLAFKDKIELEVLCEGDSLLANPYSIIAVNPALYSQVKYMEAMQLIAWVTSIEGQKIIREYKKEGEILFHPVAIK